MHDVTQDEEYYYVLGQNWNVEALVNNRGREVEHYSYDAYGQPVITAVPNAGWSTFSRFFDVKSGSWWIRAPGFSPAFSTHLPSDRPAGGGRWIGRETSTVPSSLFSFVISSQPSLPWGEARSWLASAWKSLVNGTWLTQRTKRAGRLMPRSLWW
ncbi:MAG: hypothetical protein ACE5GE_12795 [Phycisphaerae bacterium]